ncbi:unnamed protein product [Moneuplotes crassus]|uniref:Uncharacterized protein n=1 Tax=Euplotes crassus TaxID=5936 RepID=A0AAD2D469_EUPCR|nr:unnamed protein product [Moneuplotes crassus]
MLPEPNSLHHGHTDHPHLPKIFSNKKRVKIYETSKSVIEIPQRKRLRESKFFIRLQRENAAIQKLQKVAKEEVLKYQQQAASLDYAL